MGGLHEGRDSGAGLPRADDWTRPDTDVTPAPQLGKRLSLFQQLLLVQALRPDRLESGMEHFSQRALNLKVQKSSIIPVLLYPGTVSSGPEPEGRAGREQA